MFFGAIQSFLMTTPMINLAKLNEFDFEAERCRIINSYLDGLTPDQRKLALSQQLELELLRDKSTPEEFLSSLLASLRENIENLDDQVLALKHLYEPKI
jgi:hypothetical protein